MESYSVTTCLNPFFPRNIPAHLLKTACERGTKTHSICLDVYAKGIPVLGIPPECAGYFESFRNWFDLYVKEVFFLEERMADPVYCYNGKPDAGVKLADDRCVILDIKTPLAESPTWKMQGAGYLNLARIHYPEIPWGGFMSLRLRPNGSPAKATVYEDQDRDFAAFLSALNVYRYIQ